MLCRAVQLLVLFSLLELHLGVNLLYVCGCTVIHNCLSSGSLFLATLLLSYFRFIFIFIKTTQLYNNLVTYMESTTYLCLVLVVLGSLKNLKGQACLTAHCFFPIRLHSFNPPIHSCPD